MNIIEVEVCNKLFASVAEEMGIVLARSAFSSNIKERRDFSCAVFDARGELVAQAAHIPVHLGSMPKTMQHVLRHHVFAPGDVVVVNDPFHGGSHLPDITLIRSLHNHQGDVLFYLANRAHHADVGGKAPGSMGLAATLDEEGVLIPPTLLVRGGEPNHSFLSSFLRRVGNPEERRGDLRAQKASLDRGAARLTDIAGKWEQRRLDELLGELKAYAEKLMRATIAALPDGLYEGRDVLDNDGLSRRPLAIQARVRITGEEAEIDFSSSCDQVASPLNTVEAVTISATLYVFQCLMGEGFPINHGSYRPLRIITRAGSLLNALPPAPVAAGNVETSQRIVDTLFAALAPAAPNRVPAASCGSMNNIAIGKRGNRGGHPFTYYETIGGGMGGRATKPGISAIHTHMTNTMNTPVEALEHSYPLMIERYAIRRGSGGKGRHAGGDGIIRAYRFLAAGEISLLTDRRSGRPYGLWGGKAGKRGENLLIRHGKKRRLAGKINLRARQGDRLIIRTPGGGGWGEEPEGEK